MYCLSIFIIVHGGVVSKLGWLRFTTGNLIYTITKIAILTNIDRLPNIFNMPVL